MRSASRWTSSERTTAMTRFRDWHKTPVSRVEWNAPKPQRTPSDVVRMLAELMDLVEGLRAENRALRLRVAELEGQEP